MCTTVQAPKNRGHDVPWIAEMVGVHPRTIYREIEKGNLKCVRIGRTIRVMDDQLTAYLKSAEV